MNTPPYSVVVPTVGRPQLLRCLRALATSTTTGPAPQRVIVVDDRTAAAPPLSTASVPELSDLTELVELRSGGRGPAAARNTGWVVARTPWVVFLDDDVEVTHSWRDDLAADLAGASPDVGGVQGRIDVPLPRDRRPTDNERGTAGLAGSRWITADMAYRRAALERVRGFDERFRRAYREDADIALRVEAAGYWLVRGGRRTVHPVRPARWWASVRAQAGNADDALMRVLHGEGWRRRAGAPAGRRSRHLAISAAGLSALALAASGRGKLAACTALGGSVGIAELAAARVRPGPGGLREVAAMLATSVAIPPAAAYHWTSGLVRHRDQPPWQDVSPWPPPRAVLFDRDGTLVHDVAYNGDPQRVRPVPGARDVLDRLRDAGIAVGVVSNQSGVARGLLTEDGVGAVNRRVEELLGPFGAWAWCPHGPADGCGCRKPAAGLVLEAARRLGVAAHECFVVGDIGGDMAAARAAGARCVLVPTPQTRRREMRGVRIAASLTEAVTPVLTARLAERAARGDALAETPRQPSGGAA